MIVAARKTEDDGCKKDFGSDVQGRRRTASDLLRGDAPEVSQSETAKVAIRERRPWSNASTSQGTTNQDLNIGKLCCAHMIVWTLRRGKQFMQDT